jgi:hypothetical protein
MVKDHDPDSEIAIARLSYNVTKFPELLVASVEFDALKPGETGEEDKDWKHAYSRSLASRAVEELLNIARMSLTSVNHPINWHTGHNHIDVIIPARGVALENIESIVPQDVNLGIHNLARPDSVEARQIADTDKNRVRARIVKVVWYTGQTTRPGSQQEDQGADKSLVTQDQAKGKPKEDLLDNPVYRQSLSTIIQSRLHPIKALDRTIGIDDLVDYDKIGKASVSELAELANLGDECPARLRGKANLEITKETINETTNKIKYSGTFHVQFDAVLGFPKDTKLDQILHTVLGPSVDKKECLLPIRLMMGDFWVKRAYTHLKGGRMGEERWDAPFQIKKIELHAAKHRIGSETVHAYFERVHKLATDSDLPLIGDETIGKDAPGQYKSWFSLEALKLAFDQSIVGAPIIRLKMDQIGKSGMMQASDDRDAQLKTYGKILVRRITDPEEPQKLEFMGVEVDKPKFERANPITHTYEQAPRPKT